MSKYLSIFLLAIFIPLLSVAADSQFATGRWVRVEVDTTGIFEISHAELSSLGFGNPAEVAVYGHGGVLVTGLTDVAVPDEPAPTAFMHTSDSRLLFYAEADVRATLTDATQASFVRNSFDTCGVYFLSDVPAASAPAPFPFVADTSTPLRYHTHIEMIEREVQSPGEVGSAFHSVVLKPGDSERYSFPVTDFHPLPTGSTVVFRYDIAVNSQYVTRVTTRFSDNADVILNEPVQSVTNMMTNRLYNTSQGYAVLAPAAEGAFADAVIDADVCIASVFRGSYAAVDRAYIVYPRENRLRGGELFLNFVESASCPFSIAGADKDVVVWNVTNPADIRPYELRYDELSRTATGTLGSASGQRLVAFNPSYPGRHPRVCGAVEPKNLHASSAPDYLIVSTQTLLPAAEELARIHRDIQCLDVAVVAQEDIYNEFSSGMRMPEAIRRLVAMYAAREPGKLRYLLLYGPAGWDVRQILGDADDILPSYMCVDPLLVRDLTTAFHSDAFFGMTDSDFARQEIYKAPQTVSVGRLPLPDLATARVVNEKTRRRLLASPAADAFLHAVKFSDDGDARVHFDYSEEVVSLLLEGNGAMTVSRADNLLYPWTRGLATDASRKLLKTLKKGCGFMYFTGHGSESGLTAEQIYNVSFNASAHYVYAPLAFLSSCVTFSYGTGVIPMVPRMVFNPNGGAIGAIGACRPVYLEQNRPLGNAFAREYISAKPGATGADILRLARTRLLASDATAALGYNSLCYNYCGDPALPLDIPSYAIGFTLDDGTMTLPALQQRVLKGNVYGSTGHELTAFNGLVKVQIYDLPAPMRTLQRGNDDGAPVEVSADDVLLAEFGGAITDGAFSIPVALPEVTGDGRRRVVVSAVDTQSGLCAAGFRRDLTVTPPAGDSAADAPRILSLGVAPQSMTGAIVQPAFTLEARADGGTFGLAPAEALLPGVTVSLDGRACVDEASVARSYSADGTVNLSIRFRAVAPGHHTVMLRIADNCGNVAEEYIDILVGLPALAADLAVEDADPARDAAIFRADIPSGVSATLMIENADGATILRRRQCLFPFLWNLTDAGGASVPDGIYRAWLILEGNGATGSSEKCEITVVKHTEGNKY